MQNNNTYWLSIGLLIAALLVAGFFFMKPRTEGTPVGVSTSTPNGTATTSPDKNATTTDVDLGGGVVAHVPKGMTITPVDNSVKPPSFTSAIKIDPTLPADAQASLRSKEEELIRQLTADSTRLDLWLRLGMDRKVGGDFVGAAEAWNYVAKSGPSNVNYIAYGNLGDLYMNFLKDYPKAEASYKAAIALKPNVIDYYRNLAALYVSFYKTGTSAAADIVAQGLKANPNDPDLLKLQAQLKGASQ